MQCLAPMIGKNLQQDTTIIITQQMIADNKYNIRQSKPRKDNYLKAQNNGFHIGNNITEQILCMYLQKTTPSNGNGIKTKANKNFDNSGFWILKRSDHVR